MKKSLAYTIIFLLVSAGAFQLAHEVDYFSIAGIVAGTGFFLGSLLFGVITVAKAIDDFS